MKKLLLPLTCLLFLASCEKFDEETSEAFRKAATPKKNKPVERQPASSYILLQVYNDNNGAVGTFVDEVRQDWHTTYDLNYNETEDTLNEPKQANDLGINFGSEVLKVNSIPFCTVDIPISFQRAFYGQYYWLKVTCYNTAFFNPIVYDDYFKNLDGSLTSTPVHQTKDGVSLHRFEMSGDRSLKFRISVKM